MRLIKLFVIPLLCFIPCNAMIGWQKPVPTLTMLAGDAVVIHNKKDESKCPAEINDKIAWIEKIKKNPSTVLQKAIEDNNQEQIDFLLHKKVYAFLSNKGIDVSIINSLDVLSESNFVDFLEDSFSL